MRSWRCRRPADAAKADHVALLPASPEAPSASKATRGCPLVISPHVELLGTALGDLVDGAADLDSDSVDAIGKAGIAHQEVQVQVAPDNPHGRS